MGLGLLHSPSHDSGTGSSSMELPNPPPMKRQESQEQERNLLPPTEKLKCPRCDSTNTKFCYYNNYNKSQPRHFCKACKRHWTKGGMLRNVPVGGGRKNKRLKTTAAPKSSHSQVMGNQDQRLRLDFLRPQFLAQESLFNSSSNQTEFNYNTSIFGGSSVSQNHDLQFPCPSFINLDTNPYGLGIGDSDAINGPDRRSLNDKPWPLTEESTVNWGWDEIDKFVTADITIPWDDAEII